MHPTRRRNPAVPAPELIGRLRSVLGGDSLLTDPAAKVPYETDAMPIHRGQPLLVALPRDEAQVLATLRILHEAAIPWVARGAGTGLSGGAVPAPGLGVAVISLARLRRVLEIRPEQGRARVEPGIVNLALNEALAPHGLQFAPDPASQKVATIGGNIAENAGGPRALKYGVTGQHVLGLRVALGDGGVLRLGGDEETPPGYDLLGFFVGSEGTLGCILDANVRVIRRPEAAQAFLAAFPSVEAAAIAVGAILRAGVVPAALELIDALGLQTLAAAFALDLPRNAGALLVGEVDGLAEGVAAEMERSAQILRSAGATELRLAATPAERERIWAARRLVFGALGRVAPSYVQQDAAIPRSKLSHVLARIVDIGRRHDLRIANIFHAGDGNLHPAILFDDRVAGMRARVLAAEREIVRACIDAGGVLTGEHGVGLAKRDQLPFVFGEVELNMMHRLRLAFDATGGINPGKLLPGRQEAGTADFTDEEAVGPVRVARTSHDYAGAPGVGTPEPSATTISLPGRDLTSPERMVADALASAREARTHVILLGGGTLIGWPVPSPGQTGVAEGQEGGPTAVPRVLEMWPADRVVDFEPDDFALTVEAGVTLAAAERTVGAAGQRLIWEAPDPEQATLGGIVAAGYWSSLTTGYGHPKHSLLGFRAITGEGQLLCFGGRVVRNVTGYDVGKLMVGSRGSLAVLTQLILRTYPRPAQRALAVVTGEYGPLLDVAERLRQSALGWPGIDLFWREGYAQLLVALDGYPGEVKRRSEALSREVQGAQSAQPVAPMRVELLEGSEADAAQLSRLEALGWRSAPLVLRFVVSPGKARSTAECVQQACATGPTGAWRCAIHVLPAVGLLRLVFAPGFEEVPLRRLLLDLATVVREAGGYRAIDRAPSHPWWGWDVWGVPALVRDRMRRIQAAMDPRGVLTPWTGA
jgi:glycolate oxidase subunit GlcD